MYLVLTIDGLFHRWERKDSSLSVVFHKQRFPIAPQWIPPARTACLAPTECLEASDSAENAPAMLHSWNVVLLPGIRWVRCRGRGDELRLQGVVPGSPGTDQTLATVGGRPTSVNRHRSRVVCHSPDEGHLHSSAAWIHACRLHRLCKPCLFLTRRGTDALDRPYHLFFSAQGVPMLSQA